MYHPIARPDSKNLEFIEIFNSQPIPVNLAGFRIAGAVDYTFPSNTVINPGAYVVVAAVPVDVRDVYRITTGVLGPYAGALPNDSGTVRLLNKAGAVLLEATYSDDPPWPAAADGAGHSLVLARPSYGEASPEAWEISDQINGTPKQAETNRVEAVRSVRINEILAHTDPPLRDYLELFNHGNATVDLSNCFLTDDPTTNKFRIPAGTSIPPRGFLVFYEDQLGFSLSSGGEAVYFYNATRSRVVDAVRFGGQANGVAYGRFPDGGPEFHELASRTPGAANAPLLLREIVINELMYHPLSGQSREEYVELFNRSNQEVNLGGWRLVDGIRYEFPANTRLGPGGYLVVARDAGWLRSVHPHLNTINCLGNYEGTLANAGERVALAMPDQVITTNSSGGVTTQTIWITVNAVRYRDGGRWGRWSDGGGSSLELIDPWSDNRRASNWGDSDETAKAPWTLIEHRGVLDHGIFTNGVTSVHFMMQGAGECLLDAVEVQALPGLNSVQNPEFESGTTGWTFQGTHEATTQALTGYNSSRSLHVRASGRGATYMNRVLGLLTLEPREQTTVTLRARVRWLKGHPEVLLRLKGNSLEAAGQLTVPPNLGTPGLPNSRLVANAGPTVESVAHAPVLPAILQPVVVTARVQDPDGVGAVTLKYRDDPSSTYTSVPMVDNGTAGDAVAGDGIYSASIPGKAAGVLVAFYIEARDQEATPAVRVYPAEAPAREALIRWGESKPSGTFGVYRIWLTQATVSRWASREKLSNHPLPATFVYNDQRVVHEIGAFYAGSSFTSPGYNNPAGNPCMYNLHFPKDDRFLGSTDFVLDFPIRDDTAQREQTMYWIAEQLGLPYNHRRYVHVHVNGITQQQRNITIYEDTQQPGSELIEQWMGELTEGDLYKFEYWTEFADTGETRQSVFANELAQYTTTYGLKKTARYRWNWLKRAVQGSTHDYASLFQLVDAIHDASHPAYASQMESLVDIDQWMRTFALNDCASNWDSFGNGGRKNTFGFKPRQGRWVLFSADFDVGLGVFNDPPSAALFEPTDPAVQRLYDQPSLVRSYWRALDDAVNGPLASGNVNPVLDARYNTLKVTNNINVAAPNAVKTWLADRRAFLVQQLSTVASPFSITLGNGEQYSTSQTLVEITGTAPVSVKTITVNGLEYPVRWTSVNHWTLRHAVSAPDTTVVIAGLGTQGTPVPGATKSFRILYTGATPNPASHLRLSEIMYNPLQAGGSFVEVRNLSTNFSYDLTGYRINGISFTFPAGTVLQPLEHSVVAANRARFEQVYGPGLRVVGEYAGQLDNGGETLSLLPPLPSSQVIERVKYEDDPPWPAAADGLGSSLQRIDADQPADRAGNWGAVVPGAPQWEFVSITNTAGSQVLLLYLESEGEVLVDDIRLTLLGTSQNLVANGDFESPLAGSWNLSSNLVQSTTTTEDKASGAASLKLVSTAPGSSLYTSIWQPLPNVLSNGTYVLSYRYRHSTAGGRLSVRMLSGPLSSRHRLLPQAQRPFTPGESNSNARTLGSFPPVWINEVLPENTTGITDRMGDRDPWIELFNAGASTLDLSGWHLSIDPNNLAQWSFPAGTLIEAGKFLLVWADGEPGEASPTELHTSFRLPARSGTVLLSKPSGTDTLLLDFLIYEHVPAGHSFGNYPDGNSSGRQYFQNPTPRGINDNTFVPQKIWINEWLASNASALADPADGHYEDWFELFNPNAFEVNLSGWFLTDDPARPTQFRIPDGTVIPARGYLLVWADEETGQNGLHSDLHVNFKLSASGERLQLRASDQTLVDEVQFGAQQVDVTQGRFPDGAAAPFPFLNRPTPRAPNEFGNGSGMPVEITTISRSVDGLVLVAWTAEAGKTYRVEFTDSLNPADWQALPGDVTATSSVAQKSDPSAAASSGRYYRILRLN